MSPGVIFVGRLPKSFEEKQLRNYFGQFGKVKRLRLSRSKKTGNSRSFAYLEFEDEQVAKIAADSMNNYLMFEKLIKCEFIPPDKVHPQLFKGAGHKFTASWWPSINAKHHNQVKSLPDQRRSSMRILKGLESKNKALEKKGIDYEFKVPMIPRLLKKNKTEEVTKPDVKDEPMSADELDSKEMSSYSVVVDTSDDEISFKTPPNARKKTLRSVTKKKEKSEEKKKRKNNPLLKKTDKLTKKVKRYFHA